VTFRNAGPAVCGVTGVTPKTWVEPNSLGKDHAMSVSGSDFVWRVEIELAARRRWELVGLRRLRRVLESDPEVIQVRNQPWLERVVRRSIPPTITVEVAADSPGVAAQKAEQAVGRSLGALGQSPKARSWIISTDGERPSRPENVG
jgi:hypothetical protein